MSQLLQWCRKNWKDLPPRLRMQMLGAETDYEIRLALEHAAEVRAQDQAVEASRWREAIKEALQGGDECATGI